MSANQTDLTIVTGSGAAVVLPALASRVNLAEPVAWIRTGREPSPAALNGVFSVEGPFAVDDPTSIGILIGILRRSGPFSTVFLDNLLGLAGRLDINAATTAERFHEAFRRICDELKCSIIAAHPSDPETQRPRGSSAFAGMADNIILAVVDNGTARMVAVKACGMLVHLRVGDITLDLAA